MSAVTSEVLQAARRQGKLLSKAELVRLTNFSLATVTEHTELLLRSRLLVGGQKGVSTGGRKPTLLDFNANAGYILAADLESTHVRVAVLDLKLRILASSDANDIDVTKDPEQTLDQVRTLAFDLLAAQKIDAAEIFGIGMGLPGPVSHSRRKPASLPLMPGWQGFPLDAYWQRYLSCPLQVDNNVYTMALAEMHVDEEGHHGSSESKNLIFVKVGNGIGAGIVCNGSIYRGANETAGEIGHINIGHDDLCYCGNRGCLEAFAGGRAIAARAERQARDGRGTTLSQVLHTKGHLTFTDVAAALQEADPLAVSLLRESGAAIGGALSGLVNFFNPSHIVIGGTVSQVGDMLLAAIRQAIYNRSLPISTSTLSIRSATLGARAGIVGAAQLVLDDAIGYAFRNAPHNKPPNGASASA